jgi:hypothetical protein
MSHTNESNAVVKASFKESNIVYRIYELIREEVYKDQSTLVEYLINCNPHLENDAINTEYYMWEGEQLSNDDVTDLIEQYVQDLDNVSTEVYQLKSDLEAIEDCIEPTMTNDDKLTQLLEDVSNVRTCLDEKEDIESTIEDKLTTLKGLDSESYTVKRWYLVSDHILKALKEHNEIILETKFGSWWGLIDTAEPDLTQNETIRNIVTGKSQY